jgi:glutaryl-CoA dehydrogenase
LAKRNNLEIARNIASEVRQIHRGMAIMGKYPIMRHMINTEQVITYEGTYGVHLPISGNNITGIPAFK